MSQPASQCIQSRIPLKWTGFLLCLVAMKRLKVVARALVVDAHKVLLVKHKNADFWCLPGGKWEFEQEEIAACAIREVLEETGYQVEIGDLAWAQELRKDPDVYLELYWLASVTADTERASGQNDPDDEIADVGWFTTQELKKITVLPEKVRRFRDLSVHK
jgi:8-oxo-dGTP diphosphatase